MSQNKFYEKDGVLVAEFNHELNVDAIVDLVESLVPYATKADNQLMPLVLLLAEDAKQGLHPASFSKLVNNKLISHISGIYIVAKNGTMKKGAKVVNTMFLGGKARFFNEFDDALEAAKADRAQSEPILERR